MATRNNRFHDPKTRALIQASQLINVLQKHALGEDEDGKELSSSRLKAIEILLKKTVPDLSATELSGDIENPLVVTAVERTIIDPKVVKSDNAPNTNA